MFIYQKRLVLCDVDGVLLQWGKTFGTYIKDIGLVPDDHVIRPAYKVEKILNISHDEATQLITEFHCSDHFKHLSPYQDALEYVHKLAGKGYQFIAISAALQGGSGEKDDQIYVNRILNLEKHYPDIFEDLHLVPMRASKLKFLSLYQNAYWIEDTLKNAVEGIKVGHTSFFINRTEDYRIQTEGHEDVIHVETWNDIYESITQGL